MNFYLGMGAAGLFRMAREFQERGSLKSINFTWIFLIPKVESAIEIGDFKPNSLTNCSYKILANRLKAVIGEMVDESQTTSIKGRSILDSVAVAEETINHLGGGGRKEYCSRLTS